MTSWESTKWKWRKSSRMSYNLWLIMNRCLVFPPSRVVVPVSMNTMVVPSTPWPARARQHTCIISTMLSQLHSLWPAAKVSLKVHVVEGTRAQRWSMHLLFGYQIRTWFNPRVLNTSIVQAANCIPTMSLVQWRYFSCNGSIQHRVCNDYTVCL